jgi:8-oxo-dGTP diphosphatase
VTVDGRVDVNAPPAVRVAAAIIQRGDEFLLTRRPAGSHLEGLWEFPGGKCLPGEALAACLARELREELAVEAVIGDERFVVRHDYPDRRVELHFLACVLRGEPVPQLGQEMRWVPRSELDALAFPAADEALIRRLRDER